MGKACLITPVVLPHLNVMVMPIMPGVGIRDRIVASVAPAALAETRDGEIDDYRIEMLAGRQYVRPEDPIFFGLWRELVADTVVTDMLRRSHRCQAGGSGECHQQFSTHQSPDGPVRLCWLHAQEHEQIPAHHMRQMANENRARFGLGMVLGSFGLQSSHIVTIPELLVYLSRQGRSDLLPVEAMRRMLGREPDMKWSQRGGYVDTDAAYLPRLDAEVARISDPIIKLVADDEAPLTFIPRPKPIYWTNKKYLRWVKQQACCVCDKPGDDPHHMIGHGQGKMGGKAHDLLAIPLCRQCHNELHADMWTWERAHGPQSLYLQRTLDKALSLGVIA